MKIRTNPIRSLGVALALTAAVLACEDASAPGGHADISRIVLTIGGQPVTIDLNGANGSFTLNEGTHTVTAAAYDEDGDRLDIEDDYELVIASSNESVARYTSVSSFGGTLVTAPGSAALAVQIDHDHPAEFGPYDITVVID